VSITTSSFSPFGMRTGRAFVIHCLISSHPFTLSEKTMNIRATLALITILSLSSALGGCAAATSDESSVASDQQAETGATTPTTVDQPLAAAPYNGVCGSGYVVIDSLPLTGGTIYLTYNSGNGYNCVVTVRSSPGTPLPMDAYVGLSGNELNDDFGHYTTYAGPVYVHAPHQCIDWGGWIDNSFNHQPNSHCG